MHIEPETIVILPADDLQAVDVALLLGGHGDGDCQVHGLYLEEMEPAGPVVEGRHPPQW